MTGNSVELWKEPSPIVALDGVSDPPTLTNFALQLKSKERLQIAMNFEAGNYEIAASYIWLRTMALLKQQLAMLGASFIGELLQRPDIDEFSDISSVVSDAEAISLARDIGMLSKLQSIRLLQSQTIVNHFASSVESDEGVAEETMTKEDAILCLRICVQGVLAHERISAAEDFKAFRDKLAEQTLSKDSHELTKLKLSPYFFIRTAVSVLLSVIRSARGAALEHAVRNAQVIIPEMWPQLKPPERWQVGQAYAEEFNAGKKQTISGLHSALIAVRGFDYVPENLRSNTFIRVANNVIAAHNGVNNFYNEPAPMRELANLGSSIPGPAVAQCMTAALCVKLGNQYGVSWDAQLSADKVLTSMSPDRWKFYLEGRLPEDRIILVKLLSNDIVSRWESIFSDVDLSAVSLDNPEVSALIIATYEKKTARIQSIAKRMLEKL